jgi:hypothetical protein
MTKLKLKPERPKLKRRVRRLIVIFAGERAVFIPHVVNGHFIDRLIECRGVDGVTWTVT